MLYTTNCYFNIGHKKILESLNNFNNEYHI